MSSPLVQIVASEPDNLWLIGSTLLGAVVGAISSGVAAWAIARDTFNRAERNRIDALALKLIVKGKMLADTAYSIHRQIEETIAEAENAGLSGQTWTKLSGILHADLLPTFLDPDEISLLLQMKDDDLANDFILQTHRVRALELGVAEYERRRTKLTENFAANSMNGRVGSTLFTSEELAMFGPRMAEVNVLADNTRELASETHRATIELVRKLGPTIRKHLGNPSFPIGHVPKEAIPDGKQDPALGPLA